MEDSDEGSLVIPTDEELWLNSEIEWENRVGPSWVAKKVLGKGGYGIVGHWAYEGADKATKPVTDVAVKQVREREFLDGSLQWEEQFLQGLPTQHIIRMYRRVYREAGAGTNDQFDPHGPVQRMYLEFCPGGDLGARWKDMFLAGDRYSENELWAIFHCMARAVLAMHQGTEDMGETATRWDIEEIVHFDIKGDNVFIGAPAEDEEHQGGNQYKMGDFGLAVAVIPIEEQLDDDEYMFQYENRGTSIFLAPEQIPALDSMGENKRPWQSDKVGEEMVPNRYYGTCTNIWQIGLIMNLLMSEYILPEYESMALYVGCSSERLRTGGYTIGYLHDIKQDAKINSNPKKPDKFTYSNTLQTIVAECLLINPLSRPAAKELARVTLQGLILSRNTLYQTARLQNNDANIQRNWELYQEPLLSARWYSGNLALADMVAGAQATLLTTQMRELPAQVWGSEQDLGAGIGDLVEEVMAQDVEPGEVLRVDIVGARGAWGGGQDVLQDKGEAERQVEEQDYVQVEEQVEGQSWRPSCCLRSWYHCTY